MARILMEIFRDNTRGGLSRSDWMGITASEDFSIEELRKELDRIVPTTDYEKMIAVSVARENSVKFYPASVLKFPQNFAAQMGEAKLIGGIIGGLQGMKKVFNKDAQGVVQWFWKEKK